MHDTYQHWFRLFLNQSNKGLGASSNDAITFSIFSLTIKSKNIENIIASIEEASNVSLDWLKNNHIKSNADK